MSPIPRRLSFYIAGVPLTVPAGDIVLMPANQPHAVAAPERFKMLLTMIRSI